MMAYLRAVPISGTSLSRIMIAGAAGGSIAVSLSRSSLAIAHGRGGGARRAGGSRTFERRAGYRHSPKDNPDKPASLIYICRKVPPKEPEGAGKMASSLGEARTITPARIGAHVT